MQNERLADKPVNSKRMAVRRKSFLRDDLAAYHERHRRL